MRFFEKQRPEVFLHAVKLRRDKKSNLRMWQFMLIVTFSEELAKSCDVSILKQFEYMTERDAAAVEAFIASEVKGCAIDYLRSDRRRGSCAAP